jgi:pimeloyl-ACP methyl ester carboxylesterase
MNVFRKLLKIFRNILVTLLFAATAVAVVLLFWRGIKRAQIRHEMTITSENGIDEEAIVPIGGIRQYLYLRGEDVNNPVILFLHGGPGSPMIPLLHVYQKILEEHYTVVNYDQRNAGKTFFLNDADKVYGTLSINRMVEDVREVVEYLVNRFSQEKIIILGHSWGTVIGTLFVKAHPELVQAYIGTGQLVNADEGDELAFQTALERAKEAGNEEDVRHMEQLDGYLLGKNDFSVRNFKAARNLTGKYLSSGVKDNTLSNLLCSPYYSLKDISFFLKDSFALQKPLMDELSQEYDIRNLGNVYEVPVFYIVGDKDWVTPSVMAQEYFDTIEAPMEEFIMIENAGHMTMMDQPQSYCEAVIRVLEKTN